jgi:hypothetical protein
LNPHIKRIYFKEAMHQASFFQPKCATLHMSDKLDEAERSRVAAVRCSTFFLLPIEVKLVTYPEHFLKCQQKLCL